MDGSAQIPASHQLRAAISIVVSAAADRGWGSGGPVSVHDGGRLRLDDGTGEVEAATVYQAARGLVGALLDDLLRVTGRDLADVVEPWLATLQLSEAVADLDLVFPGDTGAPEVGRTPA